MSTARATTIADLTAEITDYRERAYRMGRSGYGYRANAADLHAWADEAQSDLDAMTAPRWTWRQRLEVAVSVVFAEAVFGAVLWSAVLR